MAAESNNVLTSTMTFSDEQTMLLDSATAFCKAQSPVAGVRDLLLDEHGFKADVWREMVDLGWTGVAIPEDFGGSGLGLAAVVPLVEPMGRHLLHSPFIATQLATQALIAGASEAQQAVWLPAIVQGSAASFALTEADGDWRLEHISASWRDGKLAGRKAQVLDVTTCELLVVSVLVDGAPACALLPVSAIPAGQISREVVLDETRRSYTVVLDGIELAADELLVGDAAQQALQAIERAAWLLYSADACGGIHSTIDLVVDYLNTRTQFGRKIGSYQSLKHPTVDMLTGLERARSHLYHCASLLAAKQNADVALRMAKVDSGEAYNFAADRAIQFHGGFGFTYECDAQLYLRRALWLQYQFGDAPHHRAQLQEALLDAV